MASGMTVILTPTTSATQSRAFSLTQVSRGQQATIKVVGLTSTNKAYLQMENPITGTYVNVKLDGNEIYCDVDNNLIYVGGSGKYRIDKQGSDSVGVTIESDQEYNIY